ncbi:winged helix-turn-helix transcriptional regulator [Enterobacter cloacae]|uniref:winged helix-turn-helix transcriptional regulator n=1 Tax=Enterobacter cloacae TaxID=550 RepID=UPI003315517A
MSPQSLTSVKKSSPHALVLLKHLLPHCEAKAYNRSVKLPLVYQGEAVCYLILEGNVSIYRAEDQLLLANISAPSVLGLGNNFGRIIHLVTIAPCALARVKRSDALSIIEQHNLWKTLSFFYMDLAEKLYVSFDMHTRPSAYEKIKTQLSELMTEPSSYREKISAEQYIRDKTHLSRSGVMRILASLRNGGYIELEKGILKKINNLPDKF